MKLSASTFIIPVMCRRFFILIACLGPGVLFADDYQPRNTQKPGEEPPSAAEAAKLITVPEGFQVRLFAGDPEVRQPVAMALDDRGRLFVAEAYSYHEWEKRGEDRILIFEDTDNDGHHDSRKVFVSGINHLSGMTVGRGGVWVCSSPHLLFYPDANRDDVPDGEPEVILDGWTTEAGHNFFNGLTWGPDGWLYGRHGITKPSKVGVPGTPDDQRIQFDCAIWKYHPATKKFEVVCRGTTNPWGLDWNESNDLFFTNNVNGHLWHAIPGAYYPRMGERADPFSKFVYDRIGMCCDHLHHAGAHTDWTKTRDAVGVHGELGGGHSHCGGMIYQGGKWPEKYKGKMFMCNVHGRRVNVDRLDREGVTYVARHEPDFLQANNAWFRGVQLIYGPDGDVYLSDWVDNGECHDNDGVHRTSGRIYKIIYGEPSPPMTKKLWEMSDAELTAEEDNPKQWFARMARDILHHRNPNHIERPASPRSTEGELREAAGALSSLQPLEQRWAKARDLLEKCPGDTATTDLLIYYGIKDIAAEFPEKSLELLRTAVDNHPLFTKNLSQNLAENGVFPPLVTMLESSDNEGLSESLITGFLAGIKGRKNLPAPEGWAGVFETYFAHPDFRAQAIAIHFSFDEKSSIEKLKGLLASDPSAALSVLKDHPVPDLLSALIPLLGQADLASATVAALAKIQTPEVAAALISGYASFSPSVKAEVINTLADSQKMAGALLDALGAGQIPRHAVTAYHARQIDTYRSKELSKQLQTVWGQTGSSSEDKKNQIRNWQNQLLPDVIARANLENGHTKFQQLCMACHNLHGEGGAIGPELTGANRSDLYYLIENIVDPSATLPGDYQLTVITKKDGSVLSGNIKSQNEYSLTLKNLAGEVLVSLDEIAKRDTLKQSLMPEGLLNAISPNDVRDLIGFLQK